VDSAPAEPTKAMAGNPSGTGEANTKGQTSKRDKESRLARGMYLVFVLHGICQCHILDLSIQGRIDDLQMSDQSMTILIAKVAKNSLFSRTHCTLLQFGCVTTQLAPAVQP
jgi:hypothetical protein